MMRPLTSLSACVLLLALATGCRKDTTRERATASPETSNVKQIQSDLPEDSKPMRDHATANSERATPRETQQAIPSDFRIVAQYGAGYSAWESWKYKITGDGKVTWEFGDFPANEKKTTTLLRKDVL